ncbi:MAG: AMP-binding protein, partial [Alphaproteobacteria bacterium]|nr:AMP-binding protein [Alphaproteobacteria bacterium]
MALPCTLAELVALHSADRIALAASGRAPLTFGALVRLTDRTVASLNAFGIGRNDRAAVVLPNGPEMAAAFLAVGAGATVAPLNPAYREDEFRFYLDDLSARALIVSEDESGPSVDAAARLGIPLLRLVCEEGEPAGSFSLFAEGAGAESASVKGYAGAADTALLLHTSGTTSRPKIVPLSQANVCASAAHIAETLRLEPADRGMNIMPLFHIHGLIANLLAPMHAGCSVYCTPGFDAFRVFEWFADAKPTWYSAVPTMHQAILARAGRNAGVVDALQLRFVRSSSASLPPQVMRALETLFRCPVIESYGMTEAAHQMASNPLPPAERRPGSVGV